MHLKHRKFPLIKMIKLQFEIKTIKEYVVFLHLNIEFFTGLIFQDNLGKLLRVRDNIENEVIYPQ